MIMQLPGHEAVDPTMGTLPMVDGPTKSYYWKRVKEEEGNEVASQVIRFVGAGAPIAAGASEGEQSKR